MSILTGQTSRHAPHRLDAYGSWEARSMPKSCGVITAPMGPAYTDPYACPPICWYTGHAFRQAPQRMHLLDAHEGDVRAREAGGEPRVPLVLQNQDRAGLGDGEVDAAHPEIRLGEEA